MNMLIFNPPNTGGGASDARNNFEPLKPPENVTEYPPNLYDFLSLYIRKFLKKELAEYLHFPSRDTLFKICGIFLFLIGTLEILSYFDCGKNISSQKVL